MFSWSEKQGTGNWGLIVSRRPDIAIPGVVAVDSGLEESSATSYAVPIPLGNVGDLLISVLQVDGSAFTYTIDGGSGDWTEFSEIVGDGGWCALKVIWKIADGTEGATVSFDISPDARRAVFGTLRISGHDSSVAPEISTGAAGTSATPDPDSITPSWGAHSALILAIHSNDSGTPQYESGPSGYNLEWELDTLEGTSGVGGSTHSLGFASVTTEDPGIITLTASNQWAAATIAVKGQPSSSSSSQHLLNEAGTLDPAPGQQRVDEANAMITEDGQYIFTE